MEPVADECWRRVLQLSAREETVEACYEKTFAMAPAERSCENTTLEQNIGKMLPEMSEVGQYVVKFQERLKIRVLKRL